MHALLLGSCLLLFWRCSLTEAKYAPCDKLVEQFTSKQCDPEHLTQGCQKLADRMRYKGCGHEDVENTTPVAETSPGPICSSLAPGRDCKKSKHCKPENGDRVLSSQSCPESPSGYVCCQRPLGVPPCAEGTDASGSVTACIERDVCLSKSGLLDGDATCGDGPELCCIYQP